VPGAVPFWPTTLTQAASSFVNRVSPANVGGMALNARFLQKSGVPPAAGVAAVGVNALMGAVAHLILLVIFFTLAGHQLAHAFKLPPASKLLLILAVVAALAGIVLATRLTGIGVPPGPAVSAVLTYRLATYWLPVIPGWAAWRLLQRHDYV
jgi:glycosyltransferase 2 family protein